MTNVKHKGTPIIQRPRQGHVNLIPVNAALMLLDVIQTFQA